MLKSVVRRIFVGSTITALAAFAMPVVARDVDRTGYRAIASGDFAAAEQTILAERRIYPHRPELTLNLAAVYARTGRADAARALYREVLATSPVDLVLANGNTYSSHALAQAGLLRLAPESVAAR